MILDPSFGQLSQLFVSQINHRWGSATVLSRSHIIDYLPPVNIAVLGCRMETQIRPSDGDVVKDSNDAPGWHSTQFLC